MKSKIKTVAIAGLGLMGGSLAAALRRKLPRVRIVGITRNPAALKTARKKRWIHEGYRDLSQGIRNADLIVLCTPVHTFSAAMKQIRKNAKPGTLVTDVGSVKGAIHRQMRAAAGKRVHYVSAHPMTGSHERGIQAVNPDLYQQGFVFLIRDRKGNAAAYRRVKNFWRGVMPRVIEVSPEQHDEIVASISHMPHALAACLMLSVRPSELAFAASGFRDMTRLAAGSPEIWQPIFEGNRRQVGRALEGLVRQIRHFQGLLRHKTPSKLHRFLLQAAQRGSQISL